MQCHECDFERVCLTHTSFAPSVLLPPSLPSFIIYLTSCPHSSRCAFIFTRTYTARMTYCQQFPVDLYYSIFPRCWPKWRRSDLSDKYGLKAAFDNENCDLFFLNSSIALNIVFSFVSGILLRTARVKKDVALQEERKKTERRRA